MLIKRINKKKKKIFLIAFGGIIMLYASSMLADSAVYPSSYVTDGNKTVITNEPIEDLQAKPRHIQETTKIIPIKPKPGTSPAVPVVMPENHNALDNDEQTIPN